MTIGKKGSKLFDPKMCFDAWLEYGTVEKAKKYLFEQGMVNSKGKAPHPNTIRRNTFIYIIQNPEEVREILKSSGAFYAFNDRLWADFLISKAKNVLVTSQSYKSFFAWLEINNLLEMARDLGYVKPDFSIDDVL